jgi:hypothetical protein
MSEFIKKKEMQYVIPQRKGTAKGEPIGFSKAKYEVCLRLLYRIKLKEIASIFNISYGVLRRWAIDEDFKQAVQQARDEFGEHFVNILKQKLEIWHQDNHDIYSFSPRRDIFFIPFQQIDSAVFSDYQDYDPLLREMIENKIITLLNQPLMSRFILVVINLFKTLEQGKKGPEIGFEKIIGELRNLAGCLITKGLKNIAAASDHHDHDERQYIAHAAEVLEDWVVHKTFSEWKNEQKVT